MFCARGDDDDAPAVRRFLLAILVLGMAGRRVELLLLKHDEEAIQLVPLVLLGWAWRRSRGTPQAGTQAPGGSATMVAFVAAGAAGVYYHYGANVEFQLETDPSFAAARCS